MLLIKVFTQMDSNAINNSIVFKNVYSLFLYLLTYIFCRILQNKNIKISFINELKKHNIRNLLPSFILGIIAIAIQVYVTTVYVDTLPLYINLLNIFILSAYFSISLYTLFRTNKLEITAQNLEEEKLYNKTLTYLYDNIRGFRHNFNNIVQAIGRLYFY